MLLFSLLYGGVPSVLLRCWIRRALSRAEMNLRGDQDAPWHRCVHWSSSRDSRLLGAGFGPDGAPTSVAPLAT